MLLGILLSVVKKKLLFIGVLILILILFRGSIFRGLVKYNAIGTRATIKLTNQNLIDIIEEKSNEKEVIDIKAIAIIASEITTKTLSFTTQHTSNNPNELYSTKKANCIGYSAMFNAVANYLIKKHNLEKEIKAEHKIAKLKILRIDIHQFINNSFFKDHDYNELIDLKTKEQLNIDPSLNDYFWIDCVIVGE